MEVAGCRFVLSGGDVVKAAKGKGSGLLDWEFGLCMQNDCRPERLGSGTPLGCSLLIHATKYIALPLITVHLYILSRDEQFLI